MVVQMAPRVQDGTRCRPGSLDMCIHGRCQRVGCDLRIGSSKKVDACGVCGGDGSSCDRPLYHWEASPMSLCSVTCGGGYKMSRPVCKNRVSGVEVEEQLCNEAQRPETQVVQCNNLKCPAKWVVGEWGVCSVSCGGGLRVRTVACAEEANGTRNNVPEHNCRSHRPRRQEGCGLRSCPRWETGNWSGCSVSCGSGIRVRGVECLDSDDAFSHNCDEATKPASAQTCSTGITCPSHRELNGEDNEDNEEMLPGVLYHTQPLIQLFPPAVAERLVVEQVVPSEATFIKDTQWSPCSVTCGEGIRVREVHCKIFLEFSRTIAVVPDEKCPGIKPPRETERCVLEPCSLAYGISDAAYPSDPHSIRVAGTPGKTYSWQEQGYTHCSASCLGGVQELIINCVRDDTGKIASPYMCSPETKPENRIRTCNDHPCPPRWNYSDFQPCTKSCGIGIQTREVNCIHEVTRGGGNTVVVPNNMCPQPPPPDRQYCNVLDCPARWKIGEWSRCSKSCGGGMKERRVDCKQVMAQNHEVDRPPSACATARPQDKKPCNNKSCALADKPQIAMYNSSYIQHDPKRKKVTLKIGGAGTVFFGTHVKIKCPVKRFNRTRIRWTKDRSEISPQSRKYRVSRKGVLRIQDVTYRDGGVYSCIAGESSADFVLTVKARPGVYPNYEENPHRNTLEQPSMHSRDDERARPLYQPGDDHSREQYGPGNPKPQRTATNRERMKIPSRPEDSLQHNDEVNRVDDWASQDHISTTLVSDQQQSLWPFQTFGNSLGQRLLDDHPWDDGTADPGSGADESLAVADDRLANTEARLSDHGEEKPDHSNRVATYDDKVSDRGERVLKPSDKKLIHGDQISNHGKMSDHDDRISNHGNKITGHGHQGSNRDHKLHDHDVWIPNYDERVSDKSKQKSNDGDVKSDAIVLGRGNPDALRFLWMVTDWSDCSQRCGGNGYMMRGAHCMVRLHNATQHVGAALCEDAGLEAPVTIRSCGTEPCPRWTVTAWASCDGARCFARNTAVQRRSVVCRATNASEVRADMCAEHDRPPARQECFNDKCKGTWHTDSWSECSAPCDGQGVKYRILRCVWFGTKKPAGDACRELPRPAVMKSCKGPPCHANTSVCRDHSSICQNVKVMNLCRLHHYSRQCCKSCRGHG